MNTKDKTLPKLLDDFTCGVQITYRSIKDKLDKESSAKDRNQTQLMMYLQQMKERKST